VLEQPDIELLEAARTIIRERFEEGRHHVGAALRTKSGAVFSAVHLEASVGRAAVCAEAIALGMAVALGDGSIAAIVAVDRDGNVLSPCGICREMISDYAPNANVVVADGDVLRLVAIGELLPFKG
jgi:cytidine deaminase